MNKIEDAENGKITHAFNVLEGGILTRRMFAEQWIICVELGMKVDYVKVVTEGMW